MPNKKQIEQQNGLATAMLDIGFAFNSPRQTSPQQIVAAIAGIVAVLETDNRVKRPLDGPQLSRTKREELKLLQLQVYQLAQGLTANSLSDVDVNTLFINILAILTYEADRAAAKRMNALLVMWGERGLFTEQIERYKAIDAIWEDANLNLMDTRTVLQHADWHRDVSVIYRACAVIKRADYSLFKRMKLAVHRVFGFLVTGLRQQVSELKANVNNGVIADYQSRLSAITEP